MLDNTSVVNAVIGAKQNEADALTERERALPYSERYMLIMSRVEECSDLYADMYGVPAGQFFFALRASL